jgi:peptidoglycan hydrolase-like protein with peptidoglycan-binding domain
MTAVYREVKILQEDLKDNDAYNGPITGRFDLATFNGVKALVNSGKLGVPVEIPDPSEDTYGSVIAAVADELNYMPSAVNAVRSAYSEWAREVQNMYTGPVVLSDLGAEAATIIADPASSVRLLKGLLAKAKLLYKEPIDGNYTVATENAFRQWIGSAGLDMLALLGGSPEFPNIGLTKPVLRAINTARNAAGFGARQVAVKQDLKDVKKAPTDVKKDPKRCPPGAVLYNQKRECPKGYVAIKDASGCCAPLTDSKTGNAIDQARKIADAAKVAAENARNAAKRAEEAKRKADADAKDLAKRVGAEQAAKEAQAKAFAAQATIDAANAAAEAARLRAAEEAATALAVQDATNRAAVEQAAALQAAATQAAQEAAARVAAAQEALRYAQTQSQQPPPTDYEGPLTPLPATEEESEQSSEDQPSKEVPPARQIVPVEIKTATASATPWAKYFLIAAVAAAAIAGWRWYSKNHATAETADFDADETPCSCSKAGRGERG